MPDSLGDRMKRYEAASHYTLTPRSCLFIRVDGRAFHTYTKGCNRPFDDAIIQAMISATLHTCMEMQGFKAAYVQSDEATFMLTDFDKLTSEGWFGYDLAKVISISASAFSVWFNHWIDAIDREAYFRSHVDDDFQRPRGLALFDARAFIVPQDDAPNAFIWRQQDWTRNSLQMLARSHFSHKQLHGKNTSDMHEMLHEIGVNWADLEPVYKNGTFIFHDHPVVVQEKLDYTVIKERLFPVEVAA